MASVSASTSSDTAKPNTEPEPALDISVLKEQARKGLVDALNSVNGAKTLVLDPTLAGPLSLVTEVALLKVWIDSALLFCVVHTFLLASWGRQDVLARTWSSVCYYHEHCLPLQAPCEVGETHSR